MNVWSSKVLSVGLSPLAGLPSPSSLTNFWSLGSCLGVVLAGQLLTGLVLSASYSSSLDNAFLSVVLISSESIYGSVTRSLHANGASVLFFLLFSHVGRGLYFGSGRFLQVWLSGLVLLIGFMASAFLGYVLPWGQMSFWGATVITSLVSTVPFIGPDLVSLLWGGFSVGGPTLSRFFSFHFLIPWALAAVVAGHIVALHSSGSSSPTGLCLNADNVPFHPYFGVNDLIFSSAAVLGWVSICLLAPWALGDPDNFSPANPLVTPEHIKPEWYFLFAYTVLRAIPNKLGGVLGLLMSLLVLGLAPLVATSNASSSNSAAANGVFWFWVGVWCLLTVLGGKPVEVPFIEVSQVTAVLYFLLLAVFWLITA